MTGDPCERCGEPIPAGKKSNARFCSRKCQKRWWDEKPAQCPVCGGPWTQHQTHAADKCKACETAARRAGERERMDDIVSLWNEGASQREIAEYMGYGPKSTPPILSKMMAMGLIESRYAKVRERHAK